MKICDDCKYAEWDRTKTGRLHPKNGGRCTYEYKLPPLPSSMYWISTNEPTPYGGFIVRGKNLNDHCPYWSRKDG